MYRIGHWRYVHVAIKYVKIKDVKNKIGQR